MPLVDVAQQALLEVRVAEPAGVVVAQHALHLGGGQHFAHHVEHGVVVEGIADFLQLFEQTLQDLALDRVGGDEVEDQVVLALAVAVDAAHALFEAVGVPGDVVVEEDVADLQIDAFACGLGGDEHLNGALAELLLGVQPRAGLVARAWLHAAVDRADAKAPLLEPLDQVVEGVLKLRKEQQPLIRTVEETLLVQQRLELGQLRLRARGLDGLGILDQPPQFLHLAPDLLGVGGEGGGFQQLFQPLPLALLHLLQLIGLGELRGQRRGRSRARSNFSSRRRTRRSRERRKAKVLEASRRW